MDKMDIHFYWWFWFVFCAQVRKNFPITVFQNMKHSWILVYFCSLDRRSKINCLCVFYLLFCFWFQDTGFFKQHLFDTIHKEKIPQKSWWQMFIGGLNGDFKNKFFEDFLGHSLDLWRSQSRLHWMKEGQTFLTKTCWHQFKI